MSIELSLLFWSLVVYGLYLGAQSTIYRLEYGVIFAATARDEAPPKSVALGRAERALGNFMETWPAFIILCVVAHLADPGDPVVGTVEDVVRSGRRCSRRPLAHRPG